LTGHGEKNDFIWLGAMPGRRIEWIMSARLVTLAPDNLATARFLVVARQHRSFLNGQLGVHLPGDLTMGADNSAGFAKLHLALQQRYAAAGKAFWAVRMWTNIVWQPAYLAFVAVHYARVLPDIASITQKVVGADVNGFTMAAGEMSKGEVGDLIDRAGADLRRFADAMLVEARAFANIKPLLARRLLADRILGLLLQFHYEEPERPLDQIEGLAARWLDAAGLAGLSGLEPVTMTDGRAMLILKRRTCCLDYLLDPDALCVTCPKQTEALRHARERAQIAAILME
jgi:siderophore ferric iron reductase